MEVNHKQINQLLELIRQSKPTARNNIRTLYLDRIGERIIPYCIEHYSLEQKADVRNDLLRFTIQYARSNQEVLEFAKLALNDKSKKVRRTALSIFAYARDKNQLNYLNNLRDKLQGNKEDLGNAIVAIEKQNHHLYYPQYDRWTVTSNDTRRHLKEDEFKKEVELYIEKYAKEAVSQLKDILGGLLY